MKKIILFSLFSVIYINTYAQKVINNPTNISSNVSGKITKIELSDKETILHFNIKNNGGWFAVPNETYIQSSRKEGEKLFVKKAEGIILNQRVTTTINSEGIQYKLYFPPLGKDVDKINYGEANIGGNWFIYKIDLTKSRDDLIEVMGSKSLYNLNLIREQARFKTGQNAAINFGVPSNSNIVVGYPLNTGGTLLPEDLPKEFFGNWYDKYGTLMLIATPEFLIMGNRVSYYRNIRKDENEKYIINHTNHSLHILNLDNKTMSIRNDRLHTFYKKPILNKVPNILRGTWESDKNEIDILDSHFQFTKGGDNSNVFGSKDLSVVHVAESKEGDMYWFILYNEGNHYIYIVNKIDNEFVLSRNGWNGEGYKKIKK